MVKYLQFVVTKVSHAAAAVYIFIIRDQYFLEEIACPTVTVEEMLS